jgi:putative flippase GtrA
MKLKTLFFNKQFVRFILVGGFAAGVNLVSRILLSSFFSYTTAIILAYLIGMLTAYLLCKFLVFNAKLSSTPHQIGYFIVINGVALIQTILVSILFAHYLLRGIPDLALRETIAHFIGLSIPLFTSYIGHKFITFADFYS